MNLIQLTNKAVDWLATKSRETSTRPLTYTPTEIAHALGDAPTSVGRVANEVCIRLNGLGRLATYHNSTQPCEFIIK